MEFQRLIDAGEVAEVLFGDRGRASRVYQMAREGLLPAVRLGRTVRFDPSAISEFVRTGGRAFEGGWRREPREQA